MKKIKILTDSTSDLPLETAGEYGIRVIPLNVHFGDKNYKDGVDLKPDDFYHLLKNDPAHPMTSQPTHEDFKAVYAEMTADGSDVVSIHISSKMSGTVGSAETAGKELDNGRIHIVDSGQVSISLGMIALECAKAVSNGADLQEVISLTEKLKKRIKLYFIVDSLEYLEKGGRIGHAAAIIGGILHIKPILMLHDGTVCPFEKIRGTKKVLLRLEELLRDFMDTHGKDNVKVGFIHAACNDSLEKFKEKISGIYDPRHTVTVEIGPVVGTHVGPGVLGVSFYSLT
ncbi:MAG: DegV family protein [Elusimicrobiota bacterium]